MTVVVGVNILIESLNLNTTQDRYRASINETVTVDAWKLINNKLNWITSLLNFDTKLCEDEELKPKFKNREEAESEEKICYQVFDESSRRETKK